MMSEEAREQPAYVTALEAIYGAPSQAGFGSAVFFESVSTTETEQDLEPRARAKYQHFCGEIWQRFGEANWLATWKQVYARKEDAKCDIVTELRSIPENDVRLSASMILDNADPPAKAHQALASAFDDPQVAELRVYRIGDGQAMSGLLIAAHRPPEGSLFLVFLMD